MKGQKFREMSNEALLKQEKTIKVVIGTLAGMLLIVLVIGIYLPFKQGFNTLIIFPFSLLPIVLLNLNSLKEIKKELSARNERL